MTADVDAKRLANVQAQLALAGYVLVRRMDDAGGQMFVVTKGPAPRPIDDLAELERFTAVVALKGRA